DQTNLWAGRSGFPATAALDNGTTKGYFTAFAGFVPQPDESIIDPTTMEVHIGTIRFIVTGGSFGSTANVNFIVRPTGDGGAALWFEDGSSTGSTPGNSSFSLGAPVDIHLGPIPEPSSIGLLGIASLGLLARRRR